MELKHTSPSPIDKIHCDGLFDEFLFFSSRTYQMCAGKAIVYQVEIEENEIIEASHFFYHDDAEKLQPLVEQVMAWNSCDEDMAAGLIDGTVDVYECYEELGYSDMSDVADLSFETQRYAGRAAKLLGYRAVAVRDEQGTAYMIDMTGREHEMTIVK